jgi:hypothetical protein
MNVGQRTKEVAVMSESTRGPDGPLPQRDPEHDMEQTLEHIREALRGLDFGEVSIVVQDGVVIQIERTQRKRLRKKRGGPV